MSAVLVDASVWLGHFRRANPVLRSLLENDRVLCHALIETERLYDSRCGTPQRRLRDIQRLISATAR